MTAPVSIPKNSDETTSFNRSAIKIATNGGNIDIHKGMIDNFCPQKYNFFN